MRAVARVLASLVYVAATLVSPLPVRAQEGIAGIIEEINGTVFWKRNANAKPDRLDPNSDFSRRLYPGEQLRCLRGSRLVLRLGDRRVVVPALSWYTVRPSTSVRSANIRRMLETFANVGGIRRGSGLRLFSPADLSVANPEQLVVRWIPSASGCRMSLVIRDIANNTIWHDYTVDGAAGSLDSKNARQALNDFRANSGRGPLTLVLDDNCGTSDSVSFMLLSAESELNLKQDLAFWSKTRELLFTHLGRASVFSRYGMLPEVAEEYEAALRAAPRSRDLLSRTIAAHRQTGNSVRRKELERRLAENGDPSTK